MPVIFENIILHDQYALMKMILLTRNRIGEKNSFPKSLKN